MKTKKNKNVGIILAGGSGSRMNLGYPKQFAKIAGKTVIEHTLDVFQRHHLIDEVIVVGRDNDKENIKKIILKGNYTKVCKIIQGGKERTDSTKSALAVLHKYDQDTKLIIHDANRPLLAAHIVDQCLEKLNGYNAVDVVIPCADTIVQIDNDNHVVAIPNRSELRQGQTPQAFKLHTLREAYHYYDSFGLTGTCDCSVVLKALPQEQIATVLGSETNIKLTQPIDLFLADKLFQSRNHCTLQKLVSADALNKLKDKVLVVFGGSYGIGKAVIELARKFGAKAYSFSRSNRTNVTDIDSLRNALSFIVETEKQIDYVVNTAALLANRPLEHMDTAEITEMINVNLTGAINVALVSKPYLEISKGSLLNFTSSSYTRGRAFSSVYSATKAGVVNLTQALAEEWLENEIRINCINPERTKTPMRLSNFGIEPDETLLEPETVAFASLLVLVNPVTGNILDVKRNDKQFLETLLHKDRKQLVALIDD